MVMIRKVKVKHPKRRAISLGLILGLLFFISTGVTGCGQIKDHLNLDTEPDSSSPDITQFEHELPAENNDYNPLTGLPIEPDYRNKRPVAVIFNNLKKAQPQVGVSQADILYEVPAEGGITRMMGVFQSLDGVGDLGSIRSVRPCFLQLALGHDAFFVHAGGSPEAYDDIKDWSVDHVDGVNGGTQDEKIFWRDEQRRQEKGYEHSLMTSGANISSYLMERGFRLEHSGNLWETQTFQDDGTPVNGTPAEHVTLKFSDYKTGIFHYYADSGCYLAEQYNSPYLDGATGVQVSAVNLLVLYTDIHAISGDDAGRLSIQLIGSGDGIFFCGGKAVKIQWSKADRNQPFVYTLEDGSPLVLGRGNRYVCIVDPETSTLNFT